jgi:AcrR family transcriptional regulator
MPRMAGRQTISVPRGRHAPPLDVRLGVQRRRLFQAASAVFARVGYAEASAEAISREAGMSKATFYEHFANKEECILALFDAAAAQVSRAMAAAGQGRAYDSYDEHVEAGARAFLDTLAAHRNAAQTLLVASLGASPRAAARRDAILEAFADKLYRDNARTAPRYSAPTFASRDDAFAVIGASVELVSRHLRTGRPADARALAPIITRLTLGMLDGGRRA